MGQMAKWKELIDIGISISTPSPEAIVRAALERAAKTSLKAATFELDAYHIATLIRSLASDPAEVAAIINKAGEDRG
jgi:uncharacterized protein (DUF1778 family)